MTNSLKRNNTLYPTEEAGIQNGDMVRVGEKSAEEIAVGLEKLQGLSTPSGRTVKTHPDLGANKARLCHLHVSPMPSGVSAHREVRESLSLLLGRSTAPSLWDSNHLAHQFRHPSSSDMLCQPTTAACSDASRWRSGVLGGGVLTS